MAMVDYDGAAMGRAKGHTVQVVSPQASATGAADLRILFYRSAPTIRISHPHVFDLVEVHQGRPIIFPHL